MARNSRAGRYHTPPSTPSVAPAMLPYGLAEPVGTSPAYLYIIYFLFVLFWDNFSARADGERRGPVVGRRVLKDASHPRGPSDAPPLPT